jgi:hypothetical protein
MYGPTLDPLVASYYPNITGFIHGHTKFHNITPLYMNHPSSIPSWKTKIEPIMLGANMSDILERLGIWNWTSSDKIALSVLEKPQSNVDITERIAMIHVSKE